ncbi:DMT family transporter [Rhodococcus sp. NPDC127528]|uniref:DMT family transporter n=1 Tax=unclassified Rhodococcus (in: high G+C Gram-positive bacteria) TaxID=192944 RepID=UPI003630985A
MDLPVLSVVLALVGALLFAVGSVFQQDAAAGVADDDALLSELIRSPRWWAGLLGDVGGYGFQAAALGIGSVLVVQPLIVSTLLFALPLSARFSGTRMTGRTWATAIALAISLAVFLIVGDPTAGDDSATARQWVIPLTVLAVLCVAAIAASTARIGAGPRALLLGFASGALYGVAVAMTKPVIATFEHGPGAVLGNWVTWALIVAGIGGFYLQQLAFHAGSLAASLPAITIGEPLVAAFLGFTVLGERLRVAGPGITVIVVAVIVMIATTVELSRAQANASDGKPAPDPVVS